VSVLQNNPFLLASGSPTDPTFPVQRSVRLRSSASAYFSKSTFPVSSSGTKFTMSFWMKIGTVVPTGNILAYVQTTGNGYQAGIGFANLATGQLSFWQYNGTNGFLMRKAPAMYFRDPSAWYHVVCIYDTTNATAEDRAQIWVNGVRVTDWVNNTQPALNSVSYFASNSVSPFAPWLGAENRNNTGIANPFDGYLAEVNFIDGQALTPSSFGGYNSGTGVWEPRKYSGTYGTNGFYLPFTDNTLNTLLSNSGNITAPYGGTATNALAADGVYCTSNVSAGSSFTFLLNTFASDTQVTRYSITNLSFTGGSSTFSIQSSPDNSTWTTLATLAVTASNQNFSGSINGYARYFRIAPTAFGTNGSASVDAFLLYQDGLGLDFSGNGKNWTPNNVSVTAGVTYDSMVDVPTNTSATNANFAVLNFIYKSASQPTINNGNLTVAPNAVNFQNAFSSIGVTSGKWYCEVLVSGTPNSANLIGISNEAQLKYLTITADVVGTSTGVGYSYFLLNGNKYTNATSTAYGSSIASGDIVGIALDLDSGRIWFSKNGTWQASGDPAAGTNAAFTGIASDTWSIGSTSYSGGATSFNYNFGQRPFSYTPPTGFKALNTFNLPDSTIINGRNFFDATTYTGNGSSQNVVNSNGFQPNLVWMKSRSTADNNQLQDSVRGATNRVFSNLSDAESTSATSLTSFNSNGFTVSTDANINGSGVSLVGWQWKESASAGFDIVNQTLGTTGINTINHSLGVIPRIIIAKRRNGVEQWLVYVSGATTQSQYLGLNTTAAVATSANLWGSSALTSSQFYFSGTSGNQYIFYLFADVAGFSKIGVFTANGSADGPFIYCGFRPRWVMLKDYGNPTGNWIIHDTARNSYNQAVNPLYPNGNSAEVSSQGIDFLSNGFKIRASGAPINVTNDGMLFVAFAENPFKNSLAR
jgi:hypothetical protein